MIIGGGFKIGQIYFSSKNEKEILNDIFDNLRKKNKTIIATPNPEIILESEKNKELLKFLKQVDINIPDGKGIIWAKKFLEITKNDNSTLRIIVKAILTMIMLPFNKEQTVTGTDLFEKICLDEKVSKYSIFLLGGQKGAGEKCHEIFKIKNPKINICGTFDGKATDQRCLEMPNKNGAEILFIGFGCPKQELWIKKNIKKLKSVKLAIGIGGAFDFVSGNVKRSPRLLRKYGFEWLFRLFIEPKKRIKRILNAVMVFPILIIKKRIKNQLQ